jgi:hypothetical protein
MFPPFLGVDPRIDPPDNRHRPARLVPRRHQPMQHWRGRALPALNDHLLSDILADLPLAARASA